MTLKDCWDCCECPTSCEGECTWTYHCDDPPECDCADGNCIWTWVGCACMQGSCEWSWVTGDDNYGSWVENNSCGTMCSGCSCTFDDMTNGSQPGTADPPNTGVMQVFTGTCGGTPTDSSWDLTDNCIGTCSPGASGLEYCECTGEPTVDGAYDNEEHMGYCGFAGQDPYNPSDGPCYWELTTDCGETNDSGCQCASKTCDWTWTLSGLECNGVCQYNPRTGSIMSGCDSGCDCPEKVVKTCPGKCTYYWSGSGWPYYWCDPQVTGVDTTNCGCDCFDQWTVEESYQCNVGRPNTNLANTPNTYPCTAQNGNATFCVDYDITCSGYEEFLPCEDPNSSGTWIQTSDCDCENCTCPDPPGQLSPTSGDGSTLTTHCSGVGTSGTATINCDCDIPIAYTNDCLAGQCNYTGSGGVYTYSSDNCDPGCGCPEASTVTSSTVACVDANAGGYEDEETARTPCYGGPCDTSNSACCAPGECEYIWDAFLNTWDLDSGCNGMCEYDDFRGTLSDSSQCDNQRSTTCGCPDPEPLPSCPGVCKYRWLSSHSRWAQWGGSCDCDFNMMSGWRYSICWPAPSTDLANTPGVYSCGQQSCVDVAVTCTGYEEFLPCEGGEDTCTGACTDPDVDCECHEPTYNGTTYQEPGQGSCMPVVTTAALSNRTFGLSSKIPRIRNSREEIRNSSALKVTRKGVSKVYLNVKAIKRKRRAMALKVASRRQRMR